MIDIHKKKKNCTAATEEKKSQKKISKKIDATFVSLSSNCYFFPFCESTVGLIQRRRIARERLYR